MDGLDRFSAVAVEQAFKGGAPKRRNGLVAFGFQTRSNAATGAAHALLQQRQLVVIQLPGLTGFENVFNRSIGRHAIGKAGLRTWWIGFECFLN